MLVPLLSFQLLIGIWLLHYYSNLRVKIAADRQIICPIGKSVLQFKPIEKI